MKEYLSGRGVAFTDKDISSDKEAREELVAKYKRMATPTLVINGQVFLGFKQNREEIEKMLDLIQDRTDG